LHQRFLIQKNLCPMASLAPMAAIPLEAFNVYRNNVVASLADALKAAFPVTSQLAGRGSAAGA
jgi:hypothetical protein